MFLAFSWLRSSKKLKTYKASSKNHTKASSRNNTKASSKNHTKASSKNHTKASSKIHTRAISPKMAFERSFKDLLKAFEKPFKGNHP